VIRFPYGSQLTFRFALHLSVFGGEADMPVCGSPLSRSLLGVKQTSLFAMHMSAFGQKRTSLVALHMSAFGGKADIMPAYDQGDHRHYPLIALYYDGAKHTFW
jgi:hypothetical protein